MPKSTLTTQARLNHGRWLADCPVCNGAELVVPGRPFRCQSKPCTAVAEVVWPPAKTQAAIERLLALRPNPANRNWAPGETLKQLMAENVAHAVPEKVSD